jgi:hypothetical protein
LEWWHLYRNAGLKGRSGNHAGKAVEFSLFGYTTVTLAVLSPFFCQILFGCLFKFWSWWNTLIACLLEFLDPSLTSCSSLGVLKISWSSSNTEKQLKRFPASSVLILHSNSHPDPSCDLWGPNPQNQSMTDADEAPHCCSTLAKDWITWVSSNISDCGILGIWTRFSCCFGIFGAHLCAYI